MPPKSRFTVSLPEHITEQIERFRAALGATPAEYIALITRKWFADGCPPVSAEEEQVRKSHTKRQ